MLLVKLSLLIFFAWFWYQILVLCLYCFLYSFCSSNNRSFLYVEAKALDFTLLFAIAFKIEKERQLLFSQSSKSDSHIRRAKDKKLCWFCTKNITNFRCTNTIFADNIQRRGPGQLWSRCFQPITTKHQFLGDLNAQKWRYRNILFL